MEQPLNNAKAANFSDLLYLREVLRKNVGSRQQIGSCAKSPIELPNPLSWSRQDRLCVGHGVRIESQCRAIR